MALPPAPSMHRRKLLAALAAPGCEGVRSTKRMLKPLNDAVPKNPRRKRQLKIAGTLFVSCKIQPYPANTPTIKYSPGSATSSLAVSNGKEFGG